MRWRLLGPGVSATAWLGSAAAATSCERAPAAGLLAAVFDSWRSGEPVSRASCRARRRLLCSARRSRQLLRPEPEPPLASERGHRID
jgi:hypothetical protein